MKTENYAILADGNHEYDITVHQTDESTSYEMRYSNSPIWSSHTRGEHILSATDHGNGIKFTEKIKRSMDYDNFTELRVLMNFIQDFDGNISQEYKTFKQINS
jgi:hypothetical protein